TFAMLGTSFFALTFSYVRRNTTEDMTEKAEVMAQIAAAYFEQRQGLDSREELRMMAQFASLASDMQFIITNMEGNVLLTTDEMLVGKSYMIPSSLRALMLESGAYSGTRQLTGLYDEPKFTVGTMVISESGQELGMVFALTETSELTAIWRGLLSLFWFTAVTVLLITAVITAFAVMRQVRPIHQMTQATRRYAEGNFDIRMYDDGKSVEIGELVASFNAMADSLQRTEMQRREFIANVSHELKTPMTTIAGYTDGILDGTIPPENERQYLEIIADESRRLSRLVRRMLDVSRLQSMEQLREKESFDICESMRRVLISLEKKITDRGLDVEADIPEEALLVLGDNELITQVVYNLLENAAKFAYAGSTLYLGVVPQGKKAMVTVRNEGNTIAPEEIPRLFERFHKTSKSRNEDKDGVGLGLYIVKTILEQHKETITVTSEDGVTSFIFTMELAD
ncbi:MAG: HAMP domain-containing histidine kinase, partial [Oscillospiraceae bacterium]|nr:HAMP domain-containing histidine kinase [Oscillospiraceae bacterium]